MAIAICPQVLAPPTDSLPDPLLLLLPSGQEREASPNWDAWQDLRLFGRGRHPRNFKSGTEQKGEL
jgi:hypothetical protein